MKKKTRVAINGFGRIGRAFLKIAWEKEEIEIVALNDLGDIANMAYLLKYDTVYGQWKHSVEVQDSEIIIDGKKIKVLAEKDPNLLPWKEFQIDVVVESTGLFTTFEKAQAHLEAGAQRVVISAPAKESVNQNVLGETILLGVNQEKFGSTPVTSNASCTTNAASPLIAILDENFGIEKALLNTVHGYTASQAIVDGPNKKDFREGRAGAQNIVPSSTGAAIAVTKAFPKLTNLFDGVATRVPVPAGSLVDITCVVSKNTTAEEVNDILEKATLTIRWKNIFAVTKEELVSSDILGEKYACIADLKMTRVVGGNLVKVMGWYDNEMGYTYTLVEHVIKTSLTI